MYVAFPRGNRERPVNRITDEAIKYFSSYVYSPDFSLQVVREFVESKIPDELNDLDVERILILVNSIRAIHDQPALVSSIFEYLATRGLRLNLETLDKTTWVILATRGQQDGFSILNSTLSHIPVNARAAYLTGLRYKRVEYFNGVAHPAREEPLLHSLAGQCSDHNYPILVQVVDYLLQQGMDPNSVFGEGYCALWSAQDSVACCEVLFKHKADPNIPVRFGKLPFSGVLNFGFQGPEYYGQTDYEKCLRIIQLYIANNADVYAVAPGEGTIIDVVNRCFKGHQNQDRYRRGVLDLIELRMRQIRYRNAMLVLCDKRFNATQSVFFQFPTDIMKVLTGYATLDSFSRKARK